MDEQARARALAFGRDMAAWRASEGFTVMQAAGRCGVSQGMIQSIENGLEDPLEMPPALAMHFLMIHDFTVSSAPGAADQQPAAIGADGEGGGQHHDASPEAPGGFETAPGAEISTMRGPSAALERQRDGSYLILVRLAEQPACTFRLSEGQAEQLATLLTTFAKLVREPGSAPAMERAA